MGLNNNFQYVVTYPVPPGCLALARWAGWSSGLMDRHIECCWREWNGGGALGWWGMALLR